MPLPPVEGWIRSLDGAALIRVNSDSPEAFSWVGGDWAKGIMFSGAELNDFDAVSASAAVDALKRARAAIADIPDAGISTFK